MGCMDSDRGLWTPQGLADQLAGEQESMLVRVTATWMGYAIDLDAPAMPSGDERLDVWVKAAVAYTARLRGEPVPRWTAGGALDTFWQPGPSWSFAYSLAHSPADFSVRGIFIDKDSLESV